MSLNPKIFKAYDIRGVYPSDIDETAAFLVGQAFVKFTKAKTVVVGRDMRVSSPSLFEALTRGVMSQGADVIDIGLVTTPMFYFAVGDYDLHDGGIMVTASHNPGKYNGLKLVYGNAQPIGATSGIYELRDLAMAGPYPEKPLGNMVETDIRRDYVDRVCRGVDVHGIKPLKVVVDCGNGMAGVIIKDVLSRLPHCQAEILYIEPDGNFPNHEANPLKEETLAVLRERVRALGADLGVAFDGDADRVGFVDEKGEVVRGDITHALLAGRMLDKFPGSKVAYAVNETWAIAEEVERRGGQAIMSSVGHGLVKPFMLREGILFGGEISTHYFYRDFYGSECTDLTMLIVMEMLSVSGKPLSELVAPLQRYWHSGEINSDVADKDAVLAKLKKTYGHEAAVVAEFDGLRMDFRNESAPQEDWWFSVRPSNTEPLLRLNLEAKYQAKMEEKRDELLAIIRA